MVVWSTAWKDRLGRERGRGSGGGWNGETEEESECEKQKQQEIERERARALSLRKGGKGMKIIPTTDSTISQGLKGPLSVLPPLPTLSLPTPSSPIMPKLGSQHSTWATVSHQREAAIPLPWHQWCLKNDSHCKTTADMNGVCFFFLWGGGHLSIALDCLGVILARGPCWAFSQCEKW